MSGVHKNPTISFRISDYERREIEARIKASGMMKKTFFTRCCIYGRICVVGKKETVYMLVQTIENMQADIHKMYDEIIETGAFNAHIAGYLIYTLQQLGCSASTITKARRLFFDDIVPNITAETARELGEATELNKLDSILNKNNVIHFPTED